MLALPTLASDCVDPDVDEYIEVVVLPRVKIVSRQRRPFPMRLCLMHLPLMRLFQVCVSQAGPLARPAFPILAIGKNVPAGRAQYWHAKWLIN